MSLPQIVSLISTIALTTVATVIGIQIILILKDIRHVLRKATMVVDATEVAVKSVVRPVSGFILALEGLKESSRFAEAFTNFIKRHSAPTPPVEI
jgi:hypothetical protein